MNVINAAGIACEFISGRPVIKDMTAFVKKKEISDISVRRKECPVKT